MAHVQWWTCWYILRRVCGLLYHFILLPLPYPTCLPPTPSPPPLPREALSSVQGSMASMVSHSSVQAAGMQQLQERLGQVQAGQCGGGAGRRGWEEGLTTLVMCVQ